MARIINPTTGRPAFTGPNGEGAWGSRPNGVPGVVQGTMPDGTRVWYVPGKNIDPGNVAALQAAGAPSSATGTGPTNVEGGQATIMVSPTGVTTIVAPGETAALLASGWRWPTAAEQTAHTGQVTANNPGFFGSSTAKQLDAVEFDAVSAANFHRLLREYDLEEMASRVDQWVRDDLSEAEIINRLLDPSTEEGRVVDAKYPELRLVRETGRTTPTIGAIRYYREQGAMRLRQLGVPTTFYDDPRDFTDWIVQGIDLEELTERATMAADWAWNAPTERKDQLKALYGVDEGGIAAWAFDAKKALPAIQKATRAASVAGAAQRAKFGQLTATEAERLVSLGVDEGQADGSFGQLARSGEVLNPLTGQRGRAITREEQLAAVGGDAQALDRLSREAAQRTSGFRGGGGFSESREGISGFGSARR